MNIALIPLDDRPVNLSQVELLGKIGGAEVICPPRSILGSFTTPGHGGKAGDWLKKNAGKVDGCVVSMDMIAYGGLLASRTPDISFHGAVQRLLVLKEIRANHPQIPIFAFNVLMRLSISALDNESFLHWKMIFEYSKLLDPAYAKGREKEKQKLEKEIPSSLLEDYLHTRKRNHNINLLMANWIDEGIFDYFIFCQEDAAPSGIHRFERKALLKALRGAPKGRFSVQPGADECAMMLVSRMLRTKKKPLKVFVLPSFKPALKQIALYEDCTLGETIKNKINVIGGKLVKKQTRDSLILAVHTWRNKQKDLLMNGNNPPYNPKAFLSQILKAVNAGKRTAVSDVAFANGADALFLKKLSLIPMEKLLCFSAWNTAGNTIGCALAHAAVAAEIRNIKSHIEFLLCRYIEDYLYCCYVRPLLFRKAREYAVSPWSLGARKKYFEPLLCETMTRQTNVFFKNFFQNKNIHGFIPGNIHVHFSLPWPRLFEISTQIQLNGETHPHDDH